MRRRRITRMGIGLIAVATLAACGWSQAALSSADQPSGSSTTGIQSSTAVAATAAATPAASAVSIAEATAQNEQTHEAAEDYTPNASPSTQLALNGDTISVDGTGVMVDGSTATIGAAGSYTLSGSLADGQIIVDTQDAGTVRLVLNGVTLQSSSSAPLYIRSAEKTIIELADGSQNTVTDAATYVQEDPAGDEPNAAIFAKGDLTITGNGALNVTGNYNDAIISQDGLISAGGTITASAVDDGIRGKDYLVIKNGSLSVEAGGDGMKADNEEDATQGYLSIEAGTFEVNAGDDALTAASDVLISDGSFRLTADGGSGATIDETASAKGIKARALLTIDGGLHADASLSVNAGVIEITQSYEGIETLDTDGSFAISGGFLVAAGSAGMAQAPDASSTQYAVLINSDSTQAAGTLVNIRSADGESILTFAPSKQYQSIAFSSPQLLNGTTYEISYGGSTSGTAENGLYLDGTYDSGSLDSSFTVSEMITLLGNTGCRFR